MAKRISRTKLMRRLAKSVVAFLRYCIADAVDTRNADFHHEIDARLTDLTTEKLNVVAPRGTAKSTLVSIAFVLWHIFLEPRYRQVTGAIAWPLSKKTEAPRARFVVIISKTQKEAKRRLATIKAVLGDEHGRRSDRFCALFGEWGHTTARTWREDQVVLKDGTVIMAVGTAQPVRGLNDYFVRPSLVVVDDPEDEENTKTAERMQTNLRWLFQAILPALDPNYGRVAIIGTPINAQSMVVKLHEAWRQEAEESDSLWFEQDAERDLSKWSVSPGGKIVLEDGDTLEEDDRGRWIVKQGVLWPARFPRPKLLAKKAECEATPEVGLGVYYREYEAKVIGDAEQVFTPNFFLQTWQGHLRFDAAGLPFLTVTHRWGKRLIEEETIPVAVTTGVDLAFSTAKTANKTAICNLAHDAEGNVYELPWVHEKLHPNELLDRIAYNHMRMQPRRGMIDAHGQQSYVRHDLAREKGVRYIADKDRASKMGENSRVERLHTPMKRGRWWHLEGTPIRQELTNYPRGHPDYADAAEKAYRVRMRPTHDAVAKTPTPGEKAKPHHDPMLA